VKIGLRRLVGLGGLTLPVAILVVIRPFHPADLIGPSGYSKIRAGLTRGEVWQAVGRPPGTYRRITSLRTPYQILQEWGTSPALPGGRSPESWSGGRYVLVVTYRADDEVVGCRLGEFFHWDTSDGSAPPKD
jgi:hypothetical protein